MIIGLTGGIGSGKTTVSNMFKALNVPVISTDQVTRELVNTNTPAYNEIVNYFGQSILMPNGDLNRRKLRNLIFTDKKQRIWLEKLLHPLVHDYIKGKLKQQTYRYLVIEIPLLLETTSPIQVDRILVVDCSEELQLARASTRDDLSAENIMKIIATQTSRATRINICHDVINNNTTLDALQQQVAALHEKYNCYSLN